MRAISEDTDLLQPLIISIGIGIYFFFADSIRGYTYQPFVLFSLAIMQFVGTSLFFFILQRLYAPHTKTRLSSYFILFGYALIPTLLWFLVNSVLFALIPPPRTPSLSGKGFSMVYLSFTVAVFLWKLMVMYLAIRFATRFQFFRIMYSTLLYLVLVIPYSYLMYLFGFFRIPFL